MSQTKWQINYKLNYTLNIKNPIAAHRKTPKMGLVDVKEVDSTANVINKIESKTMNDYGCSLRSWLGWLCKICWLYWPL